jgi:hypothetical protein
LQTNRTNQFVADIEYPGAVPAIAITVESKKESELEAKLSLDEVDIENTTCTINFDRI